jgi:nucleotide-binding universal stress UspA family protein
MTPETPLILCPIDFSESSRLALAHAVAIADHFGAHVIILSVDDPLLAEAVAAGGFTSSAADETRRELQHFCGDTLTSFAGPRTVEYRIAVGKPATEILREATALNVDLIVMSSHGRSGMRKLFFGSTTERVLRETLVPVLVTRDGPRTFTSLSDLGRHIGHVVVPVDLTDVSAHQVAVAQGIALALSARLLVVHALEPLFIPPSVRFALPGAERTRAAHAQERLAALMASAGGAPQAELMLLMGEPSEEIVKIAEARNAGLIVVGLRSSGALGPRMGSVTYRVLCQTGVLVLALPPEPVKTAATLEHTAFHNSAVGDGRARAQCLVKP